MEDEWRLVGVPARSRVILPNRNLVGVLLLYRWVKMFLSLICVSLRYRQSLGCTFLSAHGCLKFGWQKLHFGGDCLSHILETEWSKQPSDGHLQFLGALLYFTGWSSDSWAFGGVMTLWAEIMIQMILALSLHISAICVKGLSGHGTGMLVTRGFTRSCFSCLPPPILQTPEGMLHFCHFLFISFNHWTPTRLLIPMA